MIDTILIDRRNWNEVAPVLLEKISKASFIGFDIETEDSNRHDGLNRFMKVNADGVKSSGKPLVFDIHRTVVTGFSIYVDGDDTSYYINLNHADAENRVEWPDAKVLIDAKAKDAFWVAHNAPFEITMMMTSLGYDLGENVICSMQLAVSSYNDDEYPIDRFNEVTFGEMATLFPKIAKVFASYTSEMSSEQAELLGQVIGKQSMSTFSYNGFVKSLRYGYGLKEAIKSWFGVTMTTFNEVLGDKAHMGQLTGEEVAAYGADDAYWAVKLFHKLLAHNARFNPKINEVFFEQENPMIHVYSDVWRQGMTVNLGAVNRRREAERHNYAEVVRELKGVIRDLLPFPNEPNDSLTKREPWYVKNWKVYRSRIETLAASSDEADDLHTARQIAGAVPNAWSEETGQKKPTSVNLNHYMAQRTLMMDLCGLKPVIVKAKVASDAEARDTLIKRANKQDKPLAALAIKLIGDMQSIDTRMKLYLNPYPQLIDPQTGRIHPVLNSMTNSRRMQTRYPSPMQLAKRGDSTYIRGFYEADEPDHVIVSIDWSQIELVEIGDFSGDSGFRDAYGTLPYKDLHAKATADVLGIALEECKALPDYKKLRTDIGKGANFNYWYSGALSTVGQKLGWSSDKMWEMTDKYRASFPEAEQWRLDQIIFAREHGYVDLPDGHRRVKHDATYQWQNAMRERFAATQTPGLITFGDLFIKRLTNRAANQIVNSIIQGSCSTLAKRSILSIRKWIRKMGLRARFMVPIHDELVFSVHKDDVVGFIRGAKVIMCDHPTIIRTLPIDATASVGRTFEPYHPKKAPFGQIELDEAPDILGFKKDSKLNRTEIQVVIDYLFTREAACAKSQTKNSCPQVISQQP